VNQASTYRHTPQFNWNFGELVIDNFAGGGGASTGIEMALGRSVDVAINHDPLAISMHTVNHPTTTHYLDNVWQVDPREVTGGQPVGLAWFSPDCTHHSKARGGKPVSPRVRGLAWVVLKWAGLVRPRVIMLENVEEFEDWGQLTRSRRPCPKRKGMIFEKFVSQLRDLGYSVEWRQLRACDYGAPTIRKRLFLIARCDGQLIVWPAPTHGPGTKKKYRTAAEIIDWSIPCPSIFERKKPLAEKTLARIAKGLQRFVIDNPKPYIVEMHAPFLTEHANGSTQRVFDAEEPLRTQMAGIKGGHFALVSAFLAKHYTGVTGHGVEQPIGTITSADHHSPVTSHLLKLRGTCKDGQSTSAPLPTITAGGMHVGEVRAFLLKYYGTNIGQDISDPLQTVTSKHRFGLVTVQGVDYQIVDIGMRMLKPHELFAAQGFPENYIIDRDAQGNRITAAAQIAKCGNSVCPPVVAALVSANLADTIKQKKTA
jgi:DNA (cytosine-5)-methyltransferase 1